MNIGHDDTPNYPATVSSTFDRELPEAIDLLQGIRLRSNGFKIMTKDRATAIPVPNLSVDSCQR
jgi:hypothetical protein